MTVTLGQPQGPGVRYVSEPPPTFAYVERREPHAGNSYTAAPDSQYWKRLTEVIGWQEAPDPIRQSDYWNWNNKIHPMAQMPITSHLAIGVKESVDQQEFQVGKLLGYIRPGRQQYAGAQLPSVLRVNIQPGVPASYGSRFTMRGVSESTDINVATGMGFNYEGYQDGYPY